MNQILFQCIAGLQVCYSTCIFSMIRLRFANGCRMCGSSGCATGPWQICRALTNSSIVTFTVSHWTSAPYMSYGPIGPMHTMDPILIQLESIRSRIIIVMYQYIYIYETNWMSGRPAEGEMYYEAHAVILFSVNNYTTTTNQHLHTCAITWRNTQTHERAKR